MTERNGLDPDFLDELGIELREAQLGTRLLGRNRDDFFQDLLFKGYPSAEIRTAINRAMTLAVDHFERNVQGASLTIDRKDVCEMSFRIVIGLLFQYCAWQNNSGTPLKLRLELRAGDLDSTPTLAKIYNYCKSRVGWGPDFATNAAGLMGKSRHELDSWLGSREAFYALYY